MMKSMDTEGRNLQHVKNLSCKKAYLNDLDLIGTEFAIYVSF